MGSKVVRFESPGAGEACGSVGLGLGALEKVVEWISGLDRV